MEKTETLSKALSEIQSTLNCPKNQFNNFGKYKYRSCEDILEALKPLLTKKQVLITITDDMILLGNRYYVKATAIFSTNGIEGSAAIKSTAFAREAETKKGMDDSQITGAASSYARKYALNGLLLIDDTKDADTQDNIKSQPAKTQTTTTKPTTQQSQPESTQDKTIISEPQRKRFFGKGKEYGWSPDELKTLIKAFKYEHSKDIKRDDYNKIIEMIEKGIADIPHDETTKKEELLADIKAGSDQNVKEYELDALDKKALNLKLELHELTGSDIHFNYELDQMFKVEDVSDLDNKQKAEFVSKIANDVIKFQKEKT